MAHSHRPTTKQTHKPFKSGGHASSRTLKDIAKGKIQPDRPASCVKKTQTKLDRKNMAKQIQQNKRTKLKAQAGFFGDGRGKASRICALVSLSDATDPKYFVNGLQDYLEEPITEGPNASVHVKNFKQRLQFVVPRDKSVIAVLDAASIADYTIFIISANECLADNPYAQSVLRALQCQGISTHLSVIPDLKYDPDAMIERNEKQCQEVRKMWEADLARMFPVHHATSMYVMDSPTEIANMVRSICTSVPDLPTWRSSRAYIIPASQQMHDSGDYMVEGVVRGGSLDVDRSVHIPGLGDFLISRITSVPTGIEEEEILALPTNKQDSLTPQDLDMEPAQYEEPPMEEQLRRGVRLDDHYYMDDGEEEVEVVKKLPRGTSEYQATWITDANAVNTDDEVSDDDEAMKGLNDGNLDDDDDVMSVNGTTAPSTYAPTQAGEDPHQDLSVEEEARQLADYRAQVKDDREFPDEVDWDPERISARERFRKYRALKDFHTSRWDAEEIEANTPAWYRQILKFENFKGTRNRILKGKGGLAVGTRVRMYIRDVPRHVSDDQPLVVWSNREHECARAINHLTIQLESDAATGSAAEAEDFDGISAIKSKTEVIIQVAHRRFKANPVFSQASSGQENGLTRYEKFARADKVSIATFAGPAIIERGAPVLYFLPPTPTASQSHHQRTHTARLDDDDTGNNNGNGDVGEAGGSVGSLELVATGSFVTVDHTRLLIKRALLTGLPFKIHKRVVTVRYMFHSRADIAYFKAVQVRSKYGRRGYIKEPLGTRGYMKTTWDKVIQGQDTVVMALYKRIYPRDATYHVM